MARECARTFAVSRPLRLVDQWAPDLCATTAARRAAYNRTAGVGLTAVARTDHRALEPHVGVKCTRRPTMCTSSERLYGLPTNIAGGGKMVLSFSCSAEKPETSTTGTT